MPEIGEIGNSALDALSQRTQAEAVPKENELGQDAFLQLLVTQLSNQDPLSPSDNGDFIAQLAQFSSVEGIQSLNGSVEDMATSLRSNQALQASALVGRSVQLPTDGAQLQEGGAVQGSMTLPVPTEQIQIRVYDESGQLVNEEIMRNETTGVIAAGDIPLNWNGKNKDGEQAPAGNYRIEAEALVSGEPQALETHFNSNVDSVTIGASNEVTLNVAGVGPVSLSKVTEIF
ncbi:MAG: flagellar hook assembly protein FlgD [Pseudomonadales bacterium]